MAFYSTSLCECGEGDPLSCAYLDCVIQMVEKDRKSETNVVGAHLSQKNERQIERGTEFSMKRIQL